MDSDHHTIRRGRARPRLAPYGRDLIARVEAARRRGTFHGIAPASLDGRFADVVVYAGPHGFRQVRQTSRLHLVLPPGDNPTRYRWPVRDLACMILWADDDDGPVDGAVVLALGHELAAAGAHIVLDVNSGGRLDG